MTVTVWLGRCAGTFVIISVLGMAAASCRERQTYQVGVVLGDEGIVAARLAVESLDSASGGHGSPFRLRILSGAFGASARVALDGAERLAADPTVIGVVGHTNSSASLAASQVYNARHVVQVAPTTTAPLYSQAGPYSYRLTASDSYQARFLAAQLADSSVGRIAMVYVNDDYGRALRRMVVTEMQARGIRPPPGSAYAEDDRRDDADLVRSLVAQQPNTLVWLGREPVFTRIAGSLRTALPGLHVLASDGFGSDVVQANTDSRFDGVRYVRLVDIEHGGPALQQLRQRYRRATGREMGDQSVLSYEAVMLLGAAVREVGADRERLRIWLDALGRSHPPYQGVTGPVSFSPEGDRSPSYVLITARGPAAAIH